MRAFLFLLRPHVSDESAHSMYQSAASAASFNQKKFGKRGRSAQASLSQAREATLSGFKGKQPKCLAKKDVGPSTER